MLFYVHLQTAFIIRLHSNSDAEKNIREEGGVDEGVAYKTQCLKRYPGPISDKNVRLASFTNRKNSTTFLVKLSERIII